VADQRGDADGRRYGADHTDNPAIANVIESIAIAQAERFMGNPKAAPPTAALLGNAEFLQPAASTPRQLRTGSDGRP
jgi:hypothetical protein